MTSCTPQPGSLVGGKYRVVRALGQGGMGAVLEAEHVITERRVAIKWMRLEHAKDPEAGARFVREAQAAVRARHPHVVDIYDYGVDAGSPYLVMELLEGETLGARLRGARLSIKDAIALLLPAMRAVSEAHKRGVIHRDIKPDNIFLSRQQGLVIAKVLDFGIAKLVPRGSQELALTRPGFTLGTPRYMSLEQLTGAADVDARTDVFAFGVILYEALTGREPFPGDTFAEIALQIATSTPEPAHLVCKHIPEPLARSIARAMARDREQRTPCLDELMRAIEPFAADERASKERMLAASVAQSDDEIILPITRFGSLSWALTALFVSLLGMASWGAIHAVASADTVSNEPPRLPELVQPSLATPEATPERVDANIPPAPAHAQHRQTTRAHHDSPPVRAAEPLQTPPPSRFYVTSSGRVVTRAPRLGDAAPAHDRAPYRTSTGRLVIRAPITSSIGS